MTPAWAEARLALAGTLRLARADPRGIDNFDASIDGFWRSFRAALLCYPLYLILLSFPLEIGDGGGEVDVASLFTVETIHYVVSWVAFPLAVLPLIDWLGRGNRFLVFMVAYNWCQVPQTTVFALIALAGGLGFISADAMLICDLVAGVAALIYEWYVARVGLALSGGRALLVIAVDVLLATLLSHISMAMY
jgi:hypothetical protein